MNAPALAVTGLGAVSPFGAGAARLLAGLAEGRSAARPLVRFETPGPRSRTACTVPEECVDTADHKLARLPLAYRLGYLACEEALADAGLAPERGTPDPSRIGIFLGTFCNTEHAERYHAVLVRKGPRRVSPLLFQDTSFMAGPGTVSIRHGITGPAVAIPGGFTAGVQAAEVGARFVRLGLVDVAVVVAAEEIAPVYFGALGRLGLLSPGRGRGPELSRPFDADRNGMVLGEGAVAMVVEGRDHAAARGARTRAELAAVTLAHDGAAAGGPAQGLAGAMARALTEAGLERETVDYVAACGNGLPWLDAAEVGALKSAFGRHAYALAASSVKAGLGETGAAGALFNAAACILALETGTVFPTVHHRTPDRACDLDCVPNRARGRDVRVALASAYGFGGGSGCLLFRRPDHQ